MQSFTLIKAPGLDAAIVAAAAPGSKYIAGGTDLLQLAKDNVETPNRLVDIEPFPLAGIEADRRSLRLEALARMSDVGAHPAVKDGWRMIAQALEASASPQIRNMGTMGGNLLQRTRCGYFRDTGFACNKRDPGSGCPAIPGEHRMHAILGVSDHCIATHASDLAVALVALDATLELRGPSNANRTIPIGALHRVPGDTPHIETSLQPGELIAAARRSHYLKVRDRASFEFAVVSAAVGLEIVDGTIRDARIAAGGVGTKPWRLPEVETALVGKPLNPRTLADAANRAGDDARPARDNGFKLPLLRRTVLRALQTVAA
jgi:xanthine dehydrogenase YagS FAD-binding subunit